MRLNFGCGDKRLVAYLNIDKDASLNPDIILDCENPLPFGNDTVEEIVATDFIEHMLRARQDSTSTTNASSQRGRWCGWENTTS